MMYEQFEKKQLKTDIPVFRAGDTVKVHTKIREGDKERVQIFEGVVIKRRGVSNQASFTVRKISYGVGVERVFPLHSPMIDKIEVRQKGQVRRAKLYYLRELSGRAARITERREWEVDREKALAAEFGAASEAHVSEDTVEVKKEAKTETKKASKKAAKKTAKKEA